MIERASLRSFLLPCAFFFLFRCFICSLPLPPFGAYLYQHQLPTSAANVSLRSRSLPLVSCAMQASDENRAVLAELGAVEPLCDVLREAVEGGASTGRSALQVRPKSHPTTKLPIFVTRPTNLLPLSNPPTSLALLRYHLYAEETLITLLPCAYFLTSYILSAVRLRAGTLLLNYNLCTVHLPATLWVLF